MGFAADGYARSTRRLGVVCVTYGAGRAQRRQSRGGRLCRAGAPAGGVGGPGEAEQKLSGVHHQVKDVESQSRIFREVTCVARILEQPELAAREIHETCSHDPASIDPGTSRSTETWWTSPIPVPKHIVEWDGSFPRPRRTRASWKRRWPTAPSRLAAAKRPVLIGGVELYRERAERDFRELAEKLGAPGRDDACLAKGVFPMDHPLHMGVHIGPFSAPEIQEASAGGRPRPVDGSQLTDLNLGAAKPQVKRDRTRFGRCQGGRVNVSFHTYTEVMLKDFVANVSRRNRCLASPRSVDATSTT